MPIDPSISLQARGPQIAGPLEQYGNALALQNTMQQGQIQQVQLQNAQMQQQELQRQQQEEQAYMAAMQKYNGNIEQALPELSKVLSPKTVIGIQNHLMQQRKAQIEFDKLDVDKQKATLDNSIKRTERLGQLAGAVTDQATYEQAITQAAQEGLIPQEQAQQWLQRPYDPNAVKFLQMQAISAADQQKQKFSELQFKETQRHNQATEANQVAERDLQKRGQDITLRGQNMTDSRMREQNQIARDNKINMQKNTDMSGLTGFNADMDRLATAANEVLNHPGLGYISGKSSIMPVLPGTKAAGARGLLDTLKSQVGFSVLQNLRNNSKTGGALGQVSDRENDMLQKNLAALDLKLPDAELRKQLQKIVDYANAAKDRARMAVEQKYSGVQTSSQPKQQGTPVFAVNPQTKQRIVSYDGGQTWQAQ